MSLTAELQASEGPDLFGLLFPGEDPGDDDLFFSEGSDLIEGLLSEQDVSTALRSTSCGLYSTHHYGVCGTG